MYICICIIDIIYIYIYITVRCVYIYIYTLRDICILFVCQFVISFKKMSCQDIKRRDFNHSRSPIFPPAATALRPAQRRPARERAKGETKPWGQRCVRSTVSPGWHWQKMAKKVTNRFSIYLFANNNGILFVINH